MPDYKSDRTVNALNSYASRKLEADEKYKDWEKKAKATGEKVSPGSENRLLIYCFPIVFLTRSLKKNRTRTEEVLPNPTATAPTTPPAKYPVT